MKKSFFCILIALVAAIGISAFCGCDDNGSEEKTVTGTGSVVWHYNEEFIAIVDVTVKDNIVESVTLRPTSYVTTGADAFNLWSEEIQRNYISQYVGLTVEQIMAIDARGPQDITNHYDGGSLASDDVVVVTGATASSVTIALSIKNAVSKLQNN